MFFILISEMKRPQDAMKAAYTLQGFATTFYTGKSLPTTILALEVLINV